MIESLKDKKNLFKDECLGTYGFFIWVVPIAVLIFFSISLFTIFISASETFKGGEEYSVLILGNIFFISVTIWFLYELKVAFNITQEIKLSSTLIEVVFYFRRKIVLSPDELTTVILEKNNLILKKHRCIQTEKPCLKITTKDNKSYLITPHMERFNELTLALKEVTKNNESK